MRLALILICLFSCVKNKKVEHEEAYKVKQVDLPDNLDFDDLPEDYNDTGEYDGRNNER